MPAGAAQEIEEQLRRSQYAEVSEGCHSFASSLAGSVQRAGGRVLAVAFAYHSI